MQFNPRLTRAVPLALFGVGASLLASVTLAQQAPPTQSPELSEIVVTGSLIKRTDTETPSPVQVISAERSMPLYTHYKTAYIAADGNAGASPATH